MNAIDKFENPQRAAELSPVDTLKKLMLHEHAAFADIGAGTGLFTFAAARITTGPVYAVDISGEMREILRTRKEVCGAEHVEILDSIDRLPAGQCDMLFLCTVFHEIDDKETLLQEAKRALKADGTLAIIEFHKRETPFGPPVAHRISEEETGAAVQEQGYTVQQAFSLGENFYCLSFTAKK